MKKVFLSTIMAAALFASCSTPGKLVNLSGEWNIVSVEGQKVSSDNEPFIGFDMSEGRLYGNAGCNNIMASASVDTVKGSVELSNVGATRKMCRDMKLEGQVLTALEKVKSYRMSENGVELTDAEGKVLFGLEKRVAAVADIADLEGQWFISKVAGKDVKVIEKTPFIEFNVADGKVHGNGGCNIFNGDFTQEDNKPASLRFAQLGTTMMAGPGMEQEGLILPAFDKIRSFAVNSDGTVSLLDGNKKEVVLLKKNNGKSVAE